MARPRACICLFLILPLEHGSPAQRAHCYPARARALRLEVIAQLLGPAAVAQLAQRLALDLADALARDVELAPDFFQRAAAAVLQPEAQLQHPPLSLRERGEHLRHLLFEQLV